MNLTYKFKTSYGVDCAVARIIKYANESEPGVRKMVMVGIDGSVESMVNLYLCIQAIGPMRVKAIFFDNQDYPIMWNGYKICDKLKKKVEKDYPAAYQSIIAETLSVKDCIENQFRHNPLLSGDKSITSRADLAVGMEIMKNAMFSIDSPYIIASPLTGDRALVGDFMPVGFFATASCYPLIDFTMEEIKGMSKSIAAPIDLCTDRETPISTPKIMYDQIDAYMRAADKTSVKNYEAISRYDEASKFKRDHLIPMTPYRSSIFFAKEK